MRIINCVQGSWFKVQGKRLAPPPLNLERLLRGSGGFTFVELLIVGLIVVLVVNGMAWALVSTGQNIWRRTDSEMTLLAAVQRALDRVSEDLYQASQATVTCPAGQLTFVPAAGGTAITYSISGGNLVRTQNGTTQPMAGEITAFTPSCQANGLVRLELTAQVAMNSTTNITQVLSSQVRVQNP